MFKRLHACLDSYRRQLLLIPWFCTLAIVVGSLLPAPQVEPLFFLSDKLIHALAYGITFCSFGLFYHYNLYSLIVARLVAMGVAIEIAQGASGLRQFDVFDVVANAVGLLIGWALMRRCYRF